MKHLTVAISIFITSISSTMAQQNRLSEQAGTVKSVKQENNTYHFELTNGFAQVTPYNATTIRVRVNKSKFTGDQSYAIDDLTAKGKFTSKEEDRDNLRLYTDSLMVVVHKTPFRVSFYNKAKQLINADEDALGVSWYGNNVSCYKKLHKDEKFIGLGEKTGGINRRGNFYTHWNADVPGYALNADPLYSSIPFFIGIHDKMVYGIFFDNSHRTYFNFGGGADEELYHFGAEDGEMNYYFFGGNTVTDIIKDYTSLTGRTTMPPLWSLGFQQSRWGYDSQEQLLDIAKTFRDKKMPADVIVSDINYMDNYKIFTWNPNNFSNVKQMNAQMRRMGFDMVTIIDPGIKIEKGYKAYEEGVAKDLFAKYPNGRMYVGHVWPGRCHFPDFVKPETRKWWGESFKDSYVNNGVRGFWNDMNEPAAWGREFPNLIEFGEGKDKATLYKVKNAYGSLMSKATYEGTRALMNGQRPFVLTRAAYAGIQKYSAQWTGDNVSSDEHMLLGFRLLNSMGVSGVPYVGMDIGGFMGNPSPELFVRWMSLGVYSPLFRNHTHFGYNYREPWLFGENNTPIIRGILEQRYQLLPYLYSSFYQAHVTGMPINRMLPIAYTHDDKVYQGKFENQFLFGDNILVAPVESNKQVAEVYLPGNTNWYRLSNDEIFKGGAATYVQAPLTDLPVFVKEGAVIPMQSVIQHTKEKGDGVLYLHVYKGSTPTSFTYYEDDGETYDYEKGSSYRRTISYDPEQQKVLFGAKQGNFSSKFKRVKLILHGFGKAGKDETSALNDGAFELSLN
ncbi:glycoside hydrolase family 31 protein [Aridibaculum aurantiacum]|uniref:glycoside hydrolase family 31 protein n=1 Tax=Aridibaculum aurantiacum TaxID=2810307 RepID=UPI001A975226|nr:TIM-barrel domain-containing protein [Aridibaculum aurantiacum]